MALCADAGEWKSCECGNHGLCRISSEVAVSGQES